MVTAATVAIALLGGGGALAASRYLITSVNQVKPSVRAALRGHAGKRGPAGPQGPTGPAGPAGAVSAETEVIGNLVTISPGTPVNVSEAVCPAGHLLLAGGWKGLTADVTISDSAPTTVNGAVAWAVAAALNDAASETETFEAVAVCSQ